MCRNKFVFTVFLLFLLLFQCFCTAHPPVDIEINDRYIKTDTEPVIINDSVYVPTRFVVENLGGHIVWDDETKTATIYYDDSVISLSDKDDSAKINGEPVAFLGSVYIINDRTMIPVRFIAENFGASVFWNDIFYTVEIENEGAAPTLQNVKDYGSDEVFWLSRIVEAEAKGEPMQGKIGVANVILNRVASSEFPSTIYGVIFDKKYGVQFEPVSDGTIYNTPSKDSVASSKRALSGESAVGDCLYFLNPERAKNLWIIQNRQFYKTIQNHDFYL